MPRKAKAKEVQKWLRVAWMHDTDHKKGRPRYSLSEIAQQMGLSRQYICRILKKGIEFREKHPHLTIRYIEENGLPEDLFK